MVCIWLRTMNNTTPYPADMTEYVNKMLVKDLRHFVKVLRDNLKYEGSEANTKTGWWVANLYKIRKAELQKIIIDNKFPCNAEIMKKCNRSKYRPYFWEWYEPEWLNKFRQFLPTISPVQLAHKELRKCSRKWYETARRVAYNKGAAMRLQREILEMEQEIEKRKNRIREHEIKSTDLIEKYEKYWAKRKKAAKKLDELDTRLEMCSVCMEEKVTSERVNTKCSHHLCLDCYTQMTMIMTKSCVPCPICREEISFSCIYEVVYWCEESLEESDEE
tara:strand:+ start:184 stop:1008 length:825 start_codon:yes stop_codon:yes gene_type:complete